MWKLCVIALHECGWGRGSSRRKGRGREQTGREGSEAPALAAIWGGTPDSQLRARPLASRASTQAALQGKMSAER